MTSISARLDRLPITSTHRMAFLALAFAYFFELGDLNTFAYAAPGIIHGWGISVDTVAAITAASFGGMFIGAMTGGTLANRIGRKRAFILSTLFYSAFSLLNAFAWDVSSLAVLRFLTGIGLSSMTVIANTYIGEFFPARLRGHYMGLTMTIGLVGIPATAWVARFVVPSAPWGWRLVFVWGALGIVAIAFATRMVESPRWLSIHGRAEEADDVVRRLEKEAERHGRLPTAETRPDEPPRPRRGYMTALRAPHLGRTVFVGAISIVSTLGFYGFMAWVPTLLYQHGFSVTRSLTYTSVIALCNPVGALIAAFLMERIDRKWFNAGVSFWVAACVLLYGLADTPARIMLLGALVIIGLQAGATGLYIYSSELFPTEIRSLGVGMTYGAGRLTNVAGPFIIAAVYSSLGYSAVFLTVAGTFLLLTLLYAVLGPRTTGRPLEAVSPGTTSAQAV
ncbi:MFS transporter [Rhodopila sp.]|uniref:MFS transporter n=1 Tax=Rhodopila sp. TaxID=2480087 RepID=UPI002C33BAC4|nr:MFS transporter [Rhodopila sp.]HVZ08425.1 MFS transporter [Rhodopila sp.]